MEQVFHIVFITSSLSLNSLSIKICEKYKNSTISSNLICLQELARLYISWEDGPERSNDFCGVAIRNASFLVIDANCFLDESGNLLPNLRVQVFAGTTDSNDCTEPDKQLVYV